MKHWYVYIISKSDKLYIGMTSDIQNRLHQHGWPKLLMLEMFESKEKATNREREIKGWTAQKKRKLILEFSQL